MKKTMVALLFTACSALFLNTAEAQQVVSARTQNGFTARLVFVPDGEKVLADFQLNDNPQIPVVTTVRTQQKFSGMVIFSGCKVINNACNVKVTYRFTPPGLPTMALPEQVAWKISAPQNKNLLSNAFFNLYFNPVDPKGQYFIEAIVIDYNAGITLPLSNVVEHI